MSRLTEHVCLSVRLCIFVRTPLLHFVLFVCLQNKTTVGVGVSWIVMAVSVVVSQWNLSIFGCSSWTHTRTHMHRHTQTHCVYFGREL